MADITDYALKDREAKSFQMWGRVAIYAFFETWIRLNRRKYPGEYVGFA